MKTFLFDGNGERKCGNEVDASAVYLLCLTDALYI